MTLVTVYTPSHNSEYLDDCYNSLLNQTYKNWEWILVLNNGNNWTCDNLDTRVRIIHYDGKTDHIGALKKYACENANGEILVELDHDDILSSNALMEVVDAFNNNPDIGFVYSNCAQINNDGSKNTTTFDTRHGWTYKDVEVDGRDVMQCNAMHPFPSAISYIWYAPNHVRAFRKTTYELAGGYNPDKSILDDQDLMSRVYKLTDFYHIDKCLYLQRLHENNTQSISEKNKQIQIDTVSMYLQTIESNTLAWTRRKDLFALDMGAAHNKPDGYLGVDKYPGDGVDVVADVIEGIALEDNKVGIIRAVDFLEHIPNKIEIFNEFYRVLAHGGILLTVTPSSDGRGAFQDPTHVSFYNQNSFWYYTDANYAKYVPEIKCRFQLSFIKTYFPSEWHQQNNISYVMAIMVAIKEGSRIPGIINI